MVVCKITTGPPWLQTTIKINYPTNLQHMRYPFVFGGRNSYVIQQWMVHYFCFWCILMLILCWYVQPLSPKEWIMSWSIAKNSIINGRHWPAGSWMKFSSSLMILVLRHRKTNIHSATISDGRPPSSFFQFLWVC